MSLRTTKFHPLIANFLAGFLFLFSVVVSQTQAKSAVDRIDWDNLFNSSGERPPLSTIESLKELVAQLEADVAAETTKFSLEYAQKQPMKRFDLVGELRFLRSLHRSLQIEDRLPPELKDLHYSKQNIFLEQLKWPLTLFSHSLAASYVVYKILSASPFELGIADGMLIPLISSFVSDFIVLRTKPRTDLKKYLTKLAEHTSYDVLHPEKSNSTNTPEALPSNPTAQGSAYNLLWRQQPSLTKVSEIFGLAHDSPERLQLNRAIESDKRLYPLIADGRTTRERILELADESVSSTSARFEALWDVEAYLLDSLDIELDIKRSAATLRLASEQRADQIAYSTIQTRYPTTSHDQLLQHGQASRLEYDRLRNQLAQNLEEQQRPDEDSWDFDRWKSEALRTLEDARAANISFALAIASHPESKLGEAKTKLSRLLRGLKSARVETPSQNMVKGSDASSGRDLSPLKLVLFYKNLLAQLLTPHPILKFRDRNEEILYLDTYNTTYGVEAHSDNPNIELHHENGDGAPLVLTSRQVSLLLAKFSQLVSKREKPSDRLHSVLIAEAAMRELELGRYINALKLLEEADVDEFEDQLQSTYDEKESRRSLFGLEALKQKITDPLDAIKWAAYKRGGRNTWSLRDQNAAESQPGTSWQTHSESPRLKLKLGIQDAFSKGRRKQIAAALTVGAILGIAVGGGVYSRTLLLTQAKTNEILADTYNKSASSMSAPSNSKITNPNLPIFKIKASGNIDYPAFFAEYTDYPDNAAQPQEVISLGHARYSDPHLYQPLIIQSLATWSPTLMDGRMLIPLLNPDGYRFTNAVLMINSKNSDGEVLYDPLVGGLHYDVVYDKTRDLYFAEILVDPSSLSGEISSHTFYQPGEEEHLVLDSPIHEISDTQLDTETLLQLSRELNELGYYRLSIDLRSKLFENTELSWDDIATIFKEAALYSTDSRLRIKKEGTSLERMTGFLKNGVSCFDCDGADWLFRAFVDRYQELSSTPNGELVTFQRLVWSSDPSDLEYIRKGRLHAQSTIARFSETGEFMGSQVFDTTAAVRESPESLRRLGKPKRRPPSNGESLETPLIFYRKKLIEEEIVIEVDSPESKFSDNMSTTEVSHKPIVEKIRALQRDFSSHPEFRKWLRDKRNINLPPVLATWAGSAVIRYLETSDRAELLKSLQKLYGSRFTEAVPGSETKSINEILKSILEHQQSLIARSQDFLRRRPNTAAATASRLFYKDAILKAQTLRLLTYISEIDFTNIEAKTKTSTTAAANPNCGSSFKAVATANN